MLQDDCCRITALCLGTRTVFGKSSQGFAAAVHPGTRNCHCPGVPSSTRQEINLKLRGNPRALLQCLPTLLPSQPWRLSLPQNCPQKLPVTSPPHSRQKPPFCTSYSSMTVQTLSPPKCFQAPSHSFLTPRPSPSVPNTSSYPAKPTSPSLTNSEHSSHPVLPPRHLCIPPQLPLHPFPPPSSPLHPLLPPSLLPASPALPPAPQFPSAPPPAPQLAPSTLFTPSCPPAPSQHPLHLLLPPRSLSTSSCPPAPLCTPSCPPAPSQHPLLPPAPSQHPLHPLLPPSLLPAPSAPPPAPQLPLHPLLPPSSLSAPSPAPNSLPAPSAPLLAPQLPPKPSAPRTTPLPRAPRPAARSRAAPDPSPAGGRPAGAVRGRCASRRLPPRPPPSWRCAVPPLLPPRKQKEPPARP